MGRTGNDETDNSSTVACIQYSGIVFAEPFPSSDRGGGAHTDTQTDGRNSIEMSSGAMIYILSYGFRH
jgi:hypothetical protein